MPHNPGVRSLAAAPLSFRDPTGAPAFGSYAGPLPRVDLAERGLLARIARRKRWVWFGIGSEEILVSGAVVRTGYAITVFLFAYDLREGRMIVDETVLGPPRTARIGEDPHADGDLARFSFLRSHVALAPTGDALRLTARLRDVDLDASMDFAGAPPPVSAIARLGDGLVNATEKRALAKVSGTAKLAGRSLSLDGALGGYDYTNGLLPRHTKWRWAFGLGRDADGAPVALNFCEGFVGEAECAAFTENDVLPLPEPVFELDASRPGLPWRLTAEGVDLEFVPGAVHAQHTNLLFVRSRFLQPAGVFRGVVRAGGRELRLDALPGVVEDQDVLW